MDVPDDPNRLVRVRVARAPILHGGLLHLFSNMAFLRVFGNALAGVMNNLVYLVLYLVLGVCAAAIHLLVNGHPMIDASGAISGLLGVYLAVYLVNRANAS